MRIRSLVQTTAIASLLVAVPVAAQEVPSTVTLEQAVSLFHGVSPELRRARNRLRASIGTAQQSRAMLNPTASLTNEDLGAYSERYFTLSQGMDFVWNRGGKGRRAEARNGESRAMFLADSAQIVFGLKRAFVDAWETSEEVSALSETDRVGAAALEDAAQRYAAEDLAGYDLRRLRVARATLGRRLASAELSLEDAERRLGSLLASDGSIPRVRPQALQIEAPGISPTLDPVDRALAVRPELAAAKWMTQALDAEADLVRRSFLTGTALTGGYKQQSDGRNGLFLGIELPIPILDRRAGAVDAAVAEVDRAESEVALTRLGIARDAALADARLASARRQQQIMGGDGMEEASALLDIARVAYGEGEVGIVELVDAADAFLEARLLESTARAELWLAYFAFEHAVGGFPGGATNGETR